MIEGSDESDWNKKKVYVGVWYTYFCLKKFTHTHQHKYKYVSDRVWILLYSACVYWLINVHNYCLESASLELLSY